MNTDPMAATSARVRASLGWVRSWTTVTTLCVFTLGCGDAGDAVFSSAAAHAALERASDVHARPLGPPLLGRRTVTREFRLILGPDRFVRVKQTSPRRNCVRRGPILLLPGTLVTADFFDIPVDGYAFQTQLAERGYDTYAMEYEGTGRSSFPEDATTLNHAHLVESARSVLDWVYRRAAFEPVHVYGESNGGAIATELCRDAVRTRSCAMMSVLYADGTEFFESTFLDPGFIGFLQSLPQGYLETTPDFYFNIAGRAPADVADWVFATQPGTYPAAMPLEALHLPWFDPSRARVPGLILQGREDNVATQEDGQSLAQAYGSAVAGAGHAEWISLEGAGHVPRLEPPPQGEDFLDALFDFLDAH